ncbi:hypothetical protein T01_300 [Trichinella spiralis]|uniref:Uncharacterized protein n=1 Tax=Trichinella spiralis TaxID=6334 RepID=A0A0V1BB24_TRISP|nr:hypothetical protein T01_300 [Trichinella spiralis]
MMSNKYKVGSAYEHWRQLADIVVDVTIGQEMKWKICTFRHLQTKVIEWKLKASIIDGKLEYFIHCIVMEACTCSTMILLFNINCHYERCKLHMDNVVHMTSPSIFTCQISKKGIHYSSIQGHLLYSHNLIQISITFTGEAEQSSFAVCQMSEMLYAVLLFPLFFLIFTLYILFSSGHLVANEPKQLGTESKSCLEHFLMYFIAKIEKALRGEEMSIGGDLEGRRDR